MRFCSIMELSSNVLNANDPCWSSGSLLKATC
jgi:hypothetical protein